VQQPPDQGALAVVDAAAGDEAEEAFDIVTGKGSGLRGQGSGNGDLAVAPSEP
jgi:hypothetical protein